MSDLIKPIPVKSISETRKYGFFICFRCKNAWDSGVYWSGKRQMCRKCKRMLLPYKERDLSEIDYPSEKIAKHPQELCEKCIETGSCCINLDI